MSEYINDYLRVFLLFFLVHSMAHEIVFLLALHKSSLEEHTCEAINTVIWFDHMKCLAVMHFK